MAPSLAERKSQQKPGNMAAFALLAAPEFGPAMQAAREATPRVAFACSAKNRKTLGKFATRRPPPSDNLLDLTRIAQVPLSRLRGSFIPPAGKLE